MSKKLKIYACSGVGEAKDGINYYPFWTDDTNPVSNTQAVNTLLALINNLKIEVLYLNGLSDEEKMARLNDLCLYRVCLQAVRDLQDDPEDLANIGYVIGKWIADGKFNVATTDVSVAEEYTAQAIELINEYYHTGRPNEGVDEEFVAWWRDVIIPRNKVGLSVAKQNAVRKAEKSIKVSGIGVNPDWENNKEISNYLLNAALYFTYYYLTDAQIAQLPSVFRKKRNIQRKLYNYCKGYFVGVYGSAAEMDEIIRAGIIKEYGGTPEEVCEKIVKGEVKPVGEITAAIASIIAAAITAVVTIIVAIISCIQAAVTSKYQAVTAEQANKGCPNAEDFDGLDPETGGWIKSTSSWIPLAAIGVAILLLIKRG